jgi:dihydroorotase
MVTSNAARMLGMQDELGQLRVGGVADISVLSDERGRWILSDNEGTKVQAIACWSRCFACAPAKWFDATRRFCPAQCSLTPDTHAHGRGL